MPMPLPESPEVASWRADPDVQLMEHVRDGDLEAFDTLFNKYSGSVVKLAYQFVRSRERAEELAQTVFLQLYESTEDAVKSEVATFFDVFPNFGLKNGSGSSRHDHRANFPAVTFKQTHHSNLANKASARQFAALRFVHVTSESTDERLVNFDVTGQLVKRSVLHGFADSVKHSLMVQASRHTGALLSSTR